MADKDGWIEWEGGDCPVPKNSVFDLKYRCGEERIGAFDPELYRWSDTGKRSDIIAYRPHDVDAVNELIGFEKQSRYIDDKGGDWIDECARTFTSEEFRGAMKFTVGKYNRRIGKKDAEIAEVTKMEDYCRRWRMHLESLEKDDGL